VDPGAIESTLQLLNYRQQNPGAGAPDGDAEFVCATVDDETLFHCRMSLLPGAGMRGAAFVITFRDVTQQVDRSLIKTRTEDLRRHWPICGQRRKPWCITATWSQHSARRSSR